MKPLAESVLIPLRLTAAASQADAGMHEKLLGSGDHPSSSALNNNAILIISNDEMKDIITIVKSPENSSLIPEGVSKTIQKKAKEQREEFLSLLLGMLGASLPGNILAGKGIDRAGEGVVRAGYGRHSLNSSTSYKNKKGEKNKKKETRIWKQNEFLIPPHPLTNFEIQKYYQNEPRFNGVCSRDNLQKIKDGE